MMFNHLTTIISLSLIADNSFGAIWDCSRRFEHKSPQGTFPHTEWCADEGGRCTGPGRVYYGDHLTWTYVDYLKDGESIDCTNGAFGCDPLWGFTKKCYIQKYRCLSNSCPDEDKEVPPLNQYVFVWFDKMKILKTNDDGNSGGSVEEWRVNDQNPNGMVNNIEIHSDIIDFFGHWDGECAMRIDYIYKEPTDNLIESCNPPEDNQNADYDCVITSKPSTSGDIFEGYPLFIVSKDVFEAGLKYSFNFQIGDHDANGVFDNGPIFDFTYTEPDHKSINDLILNNNGQVVRYFTRTGPEGRQARLFVQYSYLGLSSNPTNILNCDW